REHYEQIARKVKNSRLIIVDYGVRYLPSSIFDWLQGIRLLLTGASTVAVEAMLMRVPVITMDFLSELRNVPFIDHGATYHVRTFAELGATMTIFLRGELLDIQPVVDGYLVSTLGPLDGMAAKRIADRIDDLSRTY